jgi:hypothetical protein
MARTIKHPKEIFSGIIEDFKGAFGSDLVSIILYGSAACGEYVPGKSDINFIVVLSEEGIDSIDLALGVVTKWKNRNVAIPLFLTEDFVQTSRDVFPIEYLTIQKNYEMVFGKDIFETLTFDRCFVRLQCEREIKGKLLLLREAFLETGGKARRLRNLVGESFEAIVALFNGLLYLKGKAVPEHKRDVVRQICEDYDLDRALFERLLDIKDEKVKPSEEEMKALFGGYLKQMRRLWKLVDDMESDVGDKKGGEVQ